MDFFSQKSTVLITKSRKRKIGKDSVRLNHIVRVDSWARIRVAKSVSIPPNSKVFILEYIVGEYTCRDDKVIKNKEHLMCMSILQNSNSPYAMSLSMGLHVKVQFYYSLRFNQDEILQFLLEFNNVVISKKTLTRVFFLPLSCTEENSDLLEVALILEGKLKIADKLHGYKLMHLQCMKSGYTVTQETVRLLLKIIDPQGVQLRR